MQKELCKFVGTDGATVSLFYASSQLPEERRVFGVTWNGWITWFDSYELARQVFAEQCEKIGQPTFRRHDAHPSISHD